MGYNSKPYDMHAEYSRKPIKELEEIKVHFEKYLEKPECIAHNFAVDHLWYVKLCIAKRIGRHEIQ